MPEQRTASNPDRTEPRRTRQDPDQDRGSGPPPSPEQEHGDGARRYADDGTDDGWGHDDARSDDPGYTGRDWRDDDRRRGVAPPPDDGDGRRDPDHVRTARPLHAGAVGRSSSWGPVLSGAATAFVVFLILSALWVAIAASGVEAVGDNLTWFQLLSGVLAAAAGGAAAGWLDPRGAMTGMIQGLSTWGLLVLAMAVTGLTTGTALLRSVGNVTVEADIQAASVTEMVRPFEAELWALFAVLLGGALIAALAGAGTGRAHTKLAVDGYAHGDGPDRTRGQDGR